MRRKLELARLADVTTECESLLKGGYTPQGKWSLAQICCHMRVTIDANVDGYPLWMTVLGYPLRPFLRLWVLPSLLKGKSPKGIKTAGQFVPPNGLDDAEEVQKLIECIRRFEQAREPLHGHPGFGRMSKEKFDAFHAAHAAHHLGFLKPNEVREG